MEALREMARNESASGAPGPMTSSSEPASVPTDLKFEAPADWVAERPGSSMRKAQFKLPRSAGDAEDGEFIVYFFGAGQGGSVADNLERWRGQFRNTDGSPVADTQAQWEIVTANGMNVTILEVSGRYVPGAMPGVTDSGPHENYRMIGAVIETPSGSWFVKATGPAATIAAQRDAIRNYLSSATR
jgi:hypothetical protein